MEESANQVLKITQDIVANAESQDVSIAHRISGRQKAPKPVIVKFARCVAKLDKQEKKNKTELKRSHPPSA